MKKLLILLQCVVFVTVIISTINAQNQQLNFPDENRLSYLHKQHTDRSLQILGYDDYLPDASGYQQIIGDMVGVRFTPEVYPLRIETILLNIVQWDHNPGDFLLLNIYGDGGSSPGIALLTDLPIQLTSTGSYQNWNAWIEVDISSHNLIIESGDFYVAAKWTVSESPGVGMDRTSPVDDRTWIFEGGTWSKLSDAYGVHEDMMVRVLGASCDVTCTVIEIESEILPDKFKLYQNYPNPFNPQTQFEFWLSQTSFVKVYVFNSLGQTVTILVDQTLSAGTYKVTWDGKDNSGKILPSGMYFYRLKAGEYTDTKKMILLK